MYSLYAITHEMCKDAWRSHPSFECYGVAMSEKQRNDKCNFGISFLITEKNRYNLNFPYRKSSTLGSVENCGKG